MKKKARTTRKQRREQLEKFKWACELLKTIKHYFPELVPMFREMTDERDPRYTQYELALILCVRILSAVFMYSSMRSGTVGLNDDIIIANIAKMVGCDELMELPHYTTINNCLAKVKPEELQEIVQKIISQLIRSKAFLESRINKEYWQVLIDGSQLYSFKEKHCKHCMFREHSQDGKIVSIEYYHYVLEAKLVICGNIVLSMCTEFVENDCTQEPGKIGEAKKKVSEEGKKQDCERNAFYRLAEKLKAAFPRLPICVTMDSLYACEPVFRTCAQNNWRYIIRFKDGSIKTLAAELHILKNLEPENHIEQSAGTRVQEYKFVRGMEYKGFSINAVECVETKETKKGAVSCTFVYITDLPVTASKCVTIANAGRRRWRIENEGFDVQKNHGYNLQHVFSHDYNAMKNHYFLIQIAHAISQLMALMCKEIKEKLSLSMAKMHELILAAFKKAVFTDEDIAYVARPFQVRSS
jgi:hypothetical protein